MSKVGSRSNAPSGSSIVPSTSSSVAPPPVNRQPRVGLPTNFYEVVRPFFKNYFDLQLPYHISTIFFSKVTAANYKDFHLDSHQDACNLCNINEKLSNKKYTAVDGFSMDFKLFFHNVIEKFPPDDDAVKEAKREKFDQEWPDVETKFRWG